MSTDHRGLFAKFRVERLVGSTRGIIHEGCDYFVLDATHDPLAQVALRAYADACEAESPALAGDLREMASRLGGAA